MINFTQIIYIQLITPHYSLTAKHVAKYSFNSVLAYHPDCDIAIIKHNNSNENMPSLNEAYIDKSISNYGYSFFTAMPVSSSGIVKRRILIKNSYNNKNCPAIFSNTGVVPGMSGGPVYNSKDQVIGVNIASQNGYYDLKDPQKKIISGSEGEGLLFINIGDIKDWMIKEIDKTEDKGKLVFKF